MSQNSDIVTMSDGTEVSLDTYKFNTPFSWLSEHHDKIINPLDIENILNTIINFFSNSQYKADYSYSSIWRETWHGIACHMQPRIGLDLWNKFNPQFGGDEGISFFNLLNARKEVDHIIYKL